MSDNLAAQWAKRNKMIEQKKSNALGFKYQIIDEKEKAQPKKKKQQININPVIFSTTSSSEGSRVASPVIRSPSPRTPSPRVPTPKSSPKVFKSSSKKQSFNIHQVFLVMVFIGAVITSALYYKYYFSDDYCDEVNPVDGCKKCPQDGKCYGNVLRCDEGTIDINGMCIDKSDQIALSAAGVIPKLREYLSDETTNHSKVAVKRFLGKITEEQYEAIFDLAPDIVQDGDYVKLLKPAVYNSLFGLAISLWVSFVIIGVLYFI